MKFEDIAKINKLTEQGAWVEAVRNLPGVSFLVRAEGNSEYNDLSGKLWGDVPVEKRESPTIVTAIEDELIVKTLLLGWKGIEDEFTPGNVQKFLELPVFKQAVLMASRLVATRGRETLEEDAKN